MPHFSLSGRISVNTPAWRIHSRARPGSAAESSFFNSDQTRSADSVLSFERAAALAFSPVASGRPEP